MCNCGDKRNAYAGQVYRLSNEMPNQPVKKMWNDKNFQYTGKTALTAHKEAGRILGDDAAIRGRAH